MFNNFIIKLNIISSIAKVKQNITPPQNSLKG